MQRDKKYFNKIDQHFLKNIYTRAKGQIRLAVLENDLRPILQHSQLKILDIGSGAGHLSSWLAQYGHEITLVDISEVLLDEARLKLKPITDQSPEQIKYINCDISELEKNIGNQKFDLIICHAVLEWFEDAEYLIALCARLLKINGYFSLMFYNKSALVFIQHVFGNFEYIDQGFKNPKAAKLTPTYPREQKAVSRCLLSNGFNIMSKSGVRCFYDYMKPRDKERNSIEDIIDREIMMSKNEAYFSVARYLHFVCKR